MKAFRIISPHTSQYWYDYRVYINLRDELIQRGYTEDIDSPNRIYFFGFPYRGLPINPSYNNIAYVYGHPHMAEGSFLSQFNHILVSSKNYKDYLAKKFPILTPKLHTSFPFSSLTPEPTGDDSHPAYDLVFVGNIRTRPIMEDVLPIVKKHNLSMIIYGYDWLHYQGNPDLIRYSVNRCLPYEDFPLLPKFAKIVLHDHHKEMNEVGVVSHKYVDYLAANAFVISDNNLDVPSYHGIVYQNTQHLEQLIIYYLDKPKERQKEADMQTGLVLDTLMYTTSNFVDILETNYLL